MYNTKQKCWISASYTASHLLWCREPLNREDPAAMFDLADSMLGQAEHGKRNAEAVYLMESAAKLGHAQAALAMGQLFEYGWAVQQDLRMAEQWYEKAAALGSAEAASLLVELKRERRKNRKKRLLLAFAALAAVCAVVCVIALPQLFAPVEGIIVHSDTQLITPATAEDFQAALNDLIVRYDDELVISGQRSSSRLLLLFEGSGIDLAAFPAATVIANEDNYLVIQFLTEEDAQRCLEWLAENDSVLFAETDDYNFSADDQSGDMHTTSGEPYSSPYSGAVYYSWGVEFLGLDRLASWLMTQQTEPVVVAVLDTGCEPCAENQQRYLSGYDMSDPAANGWTDNDGHGTHVAGTVIDCTWGLDVSVLPIRVFLPDGGAPDSYVVAGLQYAIQSGADVINMSLGGRCAQSDLGVSCGSAIDHYIQKASDQGIVVVIAAGNGDEYGAPENTNINCPAHMDSGIIVAACDQDGNTAPFSNYGDSVDVCAPGVEVLSYYPGDSFAYLDGTSMAAPHISALAAMLKLYLPDRSAAQIEKYITEYCVDQGDPAYYGAGIPWAGYFAGQ